MFVTREKYKSYYEIIYKGWYFFMKNYLQNSENMDKCMIGAYRHVRKECVHFNAHELANDAVRREYMENYKCMNTCIDYLKLRGYDTK